MRIQKFGIVLRSILEQDLELARSWRNKSSVRSKMIFQDIISSSDQKKWFNSLESDSCYLIIEWENIPIGLINVKNIDLKNRTGEAGIFIAEEGFQKHFISILAIHALMEAFFNEFGFSDLTATIRKDNIEAIDMNLKLGYKKISESEEILEFSIKSEEYFEKRNTISNWLDKQRSISDEIEIEKKEEQLFLKNSQ